MAEALACDDQRPTHASTATEPLTFVSPPRVQTLHLSRRCPTVTQKRDDASDVVHERTDLVERKLSALELLATDPQMLRVCRVCALARLLPAIFGHLGGHPSNFVVFTLGRPNGNSLHSSWDVPYMRQLVAYMAREAEAAARALGLRAPTGGRVVLYGFVSAAQLRFLTGAVALTHFPRQRQMPPEMQVITYSELSRQMPDAAREHVWDLAAMTTC